MAFLYLLHLAVVLCLGYVLFLSLGPGCRAAEQALFGTAGRRLFFVLIFLSYLLKYPLDGYPVAPLLGAELLSAVALSGIFYLIHRLKTS